MSKITKGIAVSTPQLPKVEEVYTKCQFSDDKCDICGEKSKELWTCIDFQNGEADAYRCRKCAEKEIIEDNPICPERNEICMFWRGKCTWDYNDGDLFCGD